jgi:hypothetical protein
LIPPERAAPVVASHDRGVLVVGTGGDSDKGGKRRKGAAILVTSIFPSNPVAVADEIRCFDR